MNKNQIPVLILLLAALTFVGLSIGMAFNIVSTPVTIQVIATPAGNNGAMTEVPAAGATAAGVPAWLAIAQDDKLPPEQRVQAVDQLAAQTGGDVNQGRECFKKHCNACHKVGGEGADHAPELSDVASRLTRQKIIESILQPSAVVEEKYKTTMVATLDGEVLTGLLIENQDGRVKLFDGKVTQEIAVDDIDIMQTKDSSSMPTKLADAMSEAEFVSLIAYLSSLKKPH